MWRALPLPRLSAQAPWFESGRFYSGTSKPSLHVRALAPRLYHIFPRLPTTKPPLALSWGFDFWVAEAVSTLWGRCPHRPVAMGGSLLSLVPLTEVR